MKLVALMFTCLGLGLLLMVLFEAWFTRLAGMACLFAFIVSGVFLIADPAFLDADEGD